MAAPKTEPEWRQQPGPWAHLTQEQTNDLIATMVTMRPRPDVIWEVKVSDGIMQYFVTEAEADFFYKDTAEAGFGVRKQAIPVPQTPKAFCMFMEQQFADHRELILAAKRLAA